MIWRRLKRLVSAMVVAAIVLAGPWLHYDKVICIQSDSHVRVERVGAGCCSQELVEFDKVSLAAGASDDDCGPCLDLRFAKEAARTPQCMSVVQTIHSTHGSILDGNLQLSVGVGDQASRRPIPLYPLAGNPFPTFHLSTVIRC